MTNRIWELYQLLITPQKTKRPAVWDAYDHMIANDNYIVVRGHKILLVDDNTWAEHDTSLSYAIKSMYSSYGYQKFPIKKGAILLEDLGKVSVNILNYREFLIVRLYDENLPKSWLLKTKEKGGVGNV